MMKKVKLFILTGLPYAGKTTLRKQLTERFGLKVISIDEINNQFGVDVEEEKPITQKDWDKAYSEAYRKLENYLAKGESIIFDGGSLLRSERETQKRIAERFGFQTVLVWVNTPEKEIIGRWLKNRETRERGHVREDDFKAALSMFEEPRSDELAILYNQEMDLEKWINEKLKIKQ